ncbi:hypothetical protein [Crocosphaera sp.]|uniref:hypothetical protein n=1 Tax=Crocosphaera sp. TaxID=2729996 RepID=UPI00261B073F|nr:hypothetical protein [Crocosphaera sp.]MDJ0582024.1 hypothetical protein [Crocosphaera sp.]
MFNKQQVIRLVVLGCFGLGTPLTDGRLTEVKAAIAEREQHEIIDKNKQDQLLAQNLKRADNKYFTGIVQSCNGATSTVICTLVYRSKETFNAGINCRDSNTKAFDSFGNVYHCSQVQISPLKSERRITMRYPKGTPIKITLTFNNIPSQTNEFHTLEVHHSASFLRFNNVEVSR